MGRNLRPPGPFLRFVWLAIGLAFAAAHALWLGVSRAEGGDLALHLISFVVTAGPFLGLWWITRAEQW